MKRPLRVAVLADTLPPRGYTGVGMVHAHLAAALADEGVEVRTFTFMELPRLWKYAVKAVLRGALWAVAWLRAPLQRPGLCLECDTAVLGALSGRILFGRVRDWKPDLVVVPDYGASASLWPRSWRRRLVLVAHSGPLRFLGVPLIGKRDPLDARLAWALEARMSREALATVVPSEYMKAVYSCDYPHRGPVAVIPNFLDERVSGNVQPVRPPLPGIKHWVFLPAPGNRNKGRAVLVELLSSMAALLAPERVAFVVSGACDRALVRRLAGLPSHAVLYIPGSLPNHESIALMKVCKICLSPTLVENFGMALLEAQFWGMPVVTFNVGGNAEVVEDGRTGRLVPQGDVAALAREGAALLKDTARCKRWGRAAAVRARDKFSGRRCGKAYVRLLRSLAQA